MAMTDERIAAVTLWLRRFFLRTIMATRDDTVIETTAGEAASELARRGVRPEQRVTIMLDERWVRPRLAVIAARMRATAAAKGLTTEVFDSLIAQD